MTRLRFNTAQSNTRPYVNSVLSCQVRSLFGTGLFIEKMQR
ncbi:hypothetical protein ACQ4M4_18795 [Leptolyngbya sp. AN02str]